MKRYLVGILFGVIPIGTLVSISIAAELPVPIVDGNISQQEWLLASKISKRLTYQNDRTGKKETHQMEVFYLNDENNLYFGIRVQGDDFGKENELVDVIELYFDNNNNQIIEVGEDIKNFWNLDYGDWHYNGDGGWSADAVVDDLPVVDGLGKARHTIARQGKIADYTYEIRMPLKSNDALDLSVDLGSEIGMKITFREMYLDPAGDWLIWDSAEDGWPTGNQNREDRFDGKTYGRIKILSKSEIHNLFTEYVTPLGKLASYWGQVKIRHYND